MSRTPVASTPAREPAAGQANSQALIALAQLFERIEHSGVAPDPAQYRALVARLTRALTEPVPQAVLQAVLARHRATSELYENLHYAHAGLSQAGLDRAVAAELQARQALARIGLASRPAARRPDHTAP
ncbi:MAG: hypothetical protein RLZZ584_1005 [Pseudomonadota bacterium]|jgi:hypothetical protein